MSNTIRRRFAAPVIRRTNVTGLVAHNMMRHIDGKHKGEYSNDCDTCSRHGELLFELTGIDLYSIIEIERRLAYIRGK